MKREEFERALSYINDHYEQGKRSADAEVSVLAHDAEQRAEIAQAHKTNEFLASQIREWEKICGEKQAEIARLRVVLEDLYALVVGECPSLFNGDSGGDAVLCLKIEHLIKKAP